MATANYTYVPGTVVYALVEPRGVRKGEVKVAKVEDKTGTPVVTYQVLLSGDNGTTEFAQSKLYADVDSALVDEKTRILDS